MADFDVSVFWERVGACAMCGDKNCKSTSEVNRCGVAGCTGPCGNPNMSRARVPGGWLVLSQTGGLAMIADEEGTWNRTKVPTPVPQLQQEAPQTPTPPSPEPSPTPTSPPPLPQSDADLLPDVDPNIVASEHPIVGSVGADSGIIEDHVDESEAGIGHGFTDVDPAEAMAKLQAKVSGAQASQTESKEKKVLVSEKHLQALQGALADFGAWVLDNYEHENTEARKLWKEVMITAGAVIPEGI